MKFVQLLNSAKLFVEGKLSGEEFSPIFEEYYNKYFDYEEINKQNNELADLLEEINEDISRFEPIEKLRLEQPNYYINEEQLRESIKRLLELKQ